MHKAHYLVLAGAAIVTSACADSVSPADRALDGEWTTGHTTVGLELGFDLTWSRNWVTGTGGINAVPVPAHCGPVIIDALTPATLSATRPSPTEIRGTVTVGSGIRMTYEGSLINANRIDGRLVTADGTQCELTMRQGLIP